MKKLIVAALAVLPLSVNAALHDRGNGLIYDDVLDITWLQDANYAKTSGYDEDGLMTFDEANTWVKSLNYAGFSNWRLPKANLRKDFHDWDNCDLSNDGTLNCGYNVNRGELGSLYYDTLGFSADPFLSIPKKNYSPFKNVYVENTPYDSLPYIYDTQYSKDSFFSYNFDFSYGSQDVANGFYLKKYPDHLHFFVWAVRDGDVQDVPVPAAAWLFGSALLGLMATRRAR